MDSILSKYLPLHTVKPCLKLIKEHNVHLKIVNQRRTRHGDYRQLPNGQHLITINATQNPYRFLITLIHELAHLVAFEKFGRYIKPHGKEWKGTFQQLMFPFIKPSVFPLQLLNAVELHFQNPMATSDVDVQLSIALKKYDENQNKIYIFELPEGAFFRIDNGRVFQKGHKLIKRFECTDIKTGKRYIFQPHASVEVVRITTQY